MLYVALVIVFHFGLDWGWGWSLIAPFAFMFIVFLLGIIVTALGAAASK